jgi:hypothetical protein
MGNCWLGEKNAAPYLKTNHSKIGCSMAQVIECLPTKHKILSLNTSNDIRPKIKEVCVLFILFDYTFVLWIRKILYWIILIATFIFLVNLFLIFVTNTWANQLKEERFILAYNVRSLSPWSAFSIALSLRWNRTSCLQQDWWSNAAHFLIGSKHRGR